MKKAKKNFLTMTIVFLVTVLSIYILSEFQYEECGESGWFENFFLVILSLFFTGFFCLIFYFCVMFAYKFISLAFIEEIRKVLNTIIPFSLLEFETKDNIIVDLIVFVVISFWGYFVWKDIIFGCI